MSQIHYATYPSLEDCPVVISGGATGIGAALVRRFAGQGAKVGFVDIAEENGTALAAELTEAGHNVQFLACDITDTPAYQSAIADFSRLHGDALVLVNNAANDHRHDWRDVTPEYWDERIAVNLKHAFFAIQAVAPGMIAAGKGSIINFGSISWMLMAGNMPVYTTAKAAAHGLSRSMARDLGPHGIRVNTLVPGSVVTERQLALWTTPEKIAANIQRQALHESVMPDDIAGMALFLAADDSRLISAQEFIVDGGLANN